MAFVRFLRQRRARRFSRDMPIWDAAHVDAQSGHVVQFYGGEFPAGAVAGFLREGIDVGEVCIVIAEPGHIKSVDALLDRPGKCIYLDAGETLEKFMVDGRPDRTRFFDTVGDVVQQAAEAGGGKVRAFGEMVVLLCERGEAAAAHDLELLWNELAERNSIRLLCSYPVSAIEGRSRGFAEPLRDAHSHAVPSA